MSIGGVRDGRGKDYLPVFTVRTSRVGRPANWYLVDSAVGGADLWFCGVEGEV